jgi:hypothetical protein
MHSHNGYFISSFSSMTLVNSFNQESEVPDDGAIQAPTHVGADIIL